MTVRTCVCFLPFDDRAFALHPNIPSQPIKIERHISKLFSTSVPVSSSFTPISIHFHSPTPLLP